ncbi:hypothetical protein BCR36DRAFT_306611, partial [Piromyces finnis]
YFQYGYTTISIESADIPDKFIYHFDETNSTVNFSVPFFLLFILIPYADNYKELINIYIESNKNKTIHVSTDCKMDNHCFSNKYYNNTCTYNV